jgi:uncharacterized protein (TIGR02611 family)
MMKVAGSRISASAQNQPSGFVKRLFGRYETARKIVVAVLGVSVLVIGTLMLVLPGPAIIVIPAGLAILATEFGWARMMLNRLKRKLQLTSKGEAERSHGAADGSQKRTNR